MGSRRPIIDERSRNTNHGPRIPMSHTLADADWVRSWDVLPKTPVEWAWLIFGLCGNIAFFTRFLVQWIHSERHKESRIPVIFWWQSLVGTIILLAYFIHKREIIGV